MSSETAAPGQQATVLENVRALLPEIKARAEEIEQARGAARPRGQLRSAGVFRRSSRVARRRRMWPDEGLTVIEELARADASVAWVAAVGWKADFSTRTSADTYDKSTPAAPTSSTPALSTRPARRSGSGRLPVQRPLAVRERLQQRRLHLHPRRDRGRAGHRFGVVPAHSADRGRLAHERAQGHLEQRHVVSDLFIPEEWTGDFAELPKIARHPLDQRGLGAVRLGVRRRRGRNSPAALDDITDITPTDPTARSEPRPPGRPVRDRPARDRPVHGAHAAAPGRPGRPGDVAWGRRTTRR